MSRPIAVPRWAIYGLVFGLYLTLRGYQSLDGDQAYRLPLLLHRQDPSLYANDPFVRAFDAFNPHRGYLALLDLASRPLGLEFGLFALFAATFALTCVGVSRLARSVWPGLGPNVGLVAVALVMMARAGNVGTNHLFEPMLLDRLIGFALGWVAMALAVEGETWRPSLFVGLAAAVHPTVGLQLGALIGAGWVAWSFAGRWTGQSWRSTGVGLTMLGLTLLPGVLPNLLQGRRLFEGLTPEELRRIGVELQMAQHMVPSLWRKPQWLAWGGYVAVGAMSLFRVALACLRAGITPHPTLPLKGGGEKTVNGVLENPPPSRGRVGWGVARAPSHDLDERDAQQAAPVRFALLFTVLLVGLGLSYVLVEIVGDLRATVFQPFRMATIARGLALIALAGRCLSLWRRGYVMGRGRVLVLAAGLTGDWAFVIAVGFEVVASLGEFSWRLASIKLTPRPNPHPQWGRGPEGLTLVLATLLVLACGFSFLMRHDTERGHRALAIALLAAVVIRILAPRRRPGWTRRRLGFALAACWLVPLAAFLAPIVAGPESPLASALAARSRFAMSPTDDVERLALWARSHTPKDARFITPPGLKTFRLWSGRSVAFNRAASPYHAAGLKDWSDRFRAHVGFAGNTDEFVRAYMSDRHGFESRYGRRSLVELADLARSQGADYVLAPATDDSGATSGPLRLLKTEGRYGVYRVERDAMVTRLP
jgi:hypothetical protein